MSPPDGRRPSPPDPTMNPTRLLPLALLAFFAAGAAQAKCNVTLELKNSNAKEVTALGSDSKAKVNGGTWSK